MPLSVKTSWKININGKTYSSPDEMPDDLRQAYEKAMANPAKAGAEIAGGSSRIKINGQEYDSPAAMTSETRQLYESALKMVKRGPAHDSHAGFSIGPAGAGEAGMSPTTPQAPISLGVAVSIALVVVLMLCSAWYFFASR